MDYKKFIESLRDEAMFQRSRFSRDIIASELESAATAIETLLAERDAAVNSLAAYKDTGLEPEEITTEPYGCVFYCNRECNLDGDFCAEGPGCPYEVNAVTAKHLLELAQAEKDGQLVVLMGGYPATPICDSDVAKNGFRSVKEAEAALKKREADNEAD